MSRLHSLPTPPGKAWRDVRVDGDLVASVALVDHEVCSGQGHVSGRACEGCFEGRVFAVPTDGANLLVPIPEMEND